MRQKSLDAERIARLLGAERRGRVAAEGGYWGALQLARDIQTRLKTPERGGRPTNPEWTERRLLPLSQQTLAKLEEIASELGISPMQLAGAIVEEAVQGRKGERR